MPEIKVGHIDDIQELRRARPMMVPERYIRDNTERPTRSRLPNSLQIPIIDMSKMIRENDVQFHHELEKLATACEEWGFFQVINHEIATNMLEEMEEVAREFFDLPLEEKEKYPMKPGTIQGYGHAFVFSEDQKLDWCNMLALGVEPPFIRDPKLWPTNPSHFSETLDKYSVEIRKLCHMLLRLIARSLRRVDENVFNEMFGNRRFKLSYNRRQTPSAYRSSKMGLGCQVLTNGKYKSVEHRAITNKKKDRLSLVTFYAPSYDVELGPLPEFVNEERPCMYRRYNHGDYSRHYVTSRLEGKKTLEFAKIAEQL
ncbi:S-norcoclaurine synthase 1 [Acorus calamus]|uniref:S-norcoclaurine synthase 1 n=1 Tax=Acorus calamus TaxID=4465 RepID=A0AAV9CSG9_ACOCL|nr:S-norcoclaurine synthase 1 [Acorus calamus]